LKKWPRAGDQWGGGRAAGGVDSAAWHPAWRRSAMTGPGNRQRMTLKAFAIKPFSWPNRGSGGIALAWRGPIGEYRPRLVTLFY